VNEVTFILESYHNLQQQGISILGIQDGGKILKAA